MNHFHDLAADSTIQLMHLKHRLEDQFTLKNTL